MTLKDQLIDRIRTVGPIRISDFMAECLMHPQLGYYATRDPFGAQGDFTTAPEMTQMFGELLGLSLAQAWADQGSPERFALAEAGPGRGTLMADLLRATRRVPGFHDALELHLIEASPALRRKQRELLGEATWHDSVDTLPDLPLFFVANEFFDALPIRQFIRDGAGWRERLVGFENAALCYGLGAVADQPALAHRLDDTEDGDLVEVCEAAAPIVASIGARIERFGGAALIVDYGDWRSLGDTLQALKSHKEVDALDLPGDADLTAHVDFEALCAAAPCAYSRVTPQGVFLERLGITQRAQTLANLMEPVQIEQHIAAHRRLTHPEEMGNLFKVVALYPSGAHPPAGVEA
ncbi:SAM-dependent methyltransferase [Cognatishimia sp. SS12]|uniref:class I SAM-dependent methyltransferase n=1 Tax=Cognatishimia sp. SS12 TaxID=2979465 RepID=UPI00232DDC4A|nr:SAM-dependent methyltransferase [Cognatishimia sp. SS12]MDC0738244.1 SAM-dependent methyltransferase [Cognatishimia sp. SS12]